MKKLIIAAAVAASLSSTAFAADLDTEVVDPVFGWGGFYAGVQIGYGRGDHDRALLAGGISNSYDSTGALGGIFAGYNHELSDRVIVGLEGDINISGIDGDDGNAGGSLDTTELEWLGSVRARLGYAGDRTLWFVSGGLAVGGLDHTNDSGGGESYSNTETGWTVGGGVEFAATTDWTVRAEYRYYDLGTYTRRNPTNGNAPYEVDNDFHTFLIGVARKF